MIWKARHFEFRFPRPAVIMGIVNVTPDSFSDGGRFLAPESAIEHGMELVRQGADILDIGGESSRPGAESVTESEELRRVIPVIEALASRVSVPLSVDTVKPGVAEAAFRAGASIVNDIAANRGDLEIWRIAARFQAGYVAMHMQGTPRTMQVAPRYNDVAGEVFSFFRETLSRMGQAGLGADHVALDVGIGFGKSPDHNLELLGRMALFTQIPRPRVLGVSRKSFLGHLAGASVDHRLPGALAVSCLARQEGVEVYRTHDVAETVQALRVADAVLARRPAGSSQKHGIA